MHQLSISVSGVVNYIASIMNTCLVHEGCNELLLAVFLNYTVVYHAVDTQHFKKITM